MLRENLNILSRKYPSLAKIDIQRIEEMISIIVESSTTDMLKQLLPPDVSASILSALCNHCRFIHGGLLVFTPALSELQGLMEDIGFPIERIFPSVIVQRRICKRYGLDEKLVNIHILQSNLKSKDSPSKYIEIFVFPQDTPGLTEEICQTERSEELETHFAFQPVHPDIITINGIITTLKRYGNFSDDGGGRNPFEDACAGGKTVVYLLRLANDATYNNRPIRMEITW